MFELATQIFGVVRGPRDVCASDADDVSAGYSEVPATHMVFVRGYKDVCTIDAAGGCAGVQRHTVLAMQRHPIPRWATPMLLTPPSFPLSERGSVPALTPDGDLLGRGFDSVCISFINRVRRLFACGCVTLLPPPKLQAIAPRVFVLEIMWHDYFVNSWGSLLDLGFGSLRCVDIGVTLGRLVQRLVRDGAMFLRCHPWDGLTVMTSRSVGLPEGKSSDCWSRWKFLLHICYMQRSYWIWGPPPCSSRRDKAVDTDHAAIGARTKPLEPTEVSHLRARELHAPPPEIVAAAFAAVLRRRSTGRPSPDHRQTVAGPPLRRCRNATEPL
ncbi:hypothetical protein DY000_02021754 [Brassica cretica]|uniref:Uncharacterized protein n=1 Tax=Brassica cretica TaxID=69181 RepID=A0ABQ7E106_BRACR|nr:hypothetical protein DY000_02021754 [Brassica cretica]